MTSPFESAVRRLVSGGDITQLSLEIYSLLSTTERLWLLDGDLDFTQGVKAVIRSGYNSVPYSSGAIKRIGLPGIQFSDGPRGCVMGNSTAFPVPMSRAATFDVELEERIGTAIGKEVRAQGGNLFGGVCVNLVRHPAWGRAQESYGEDPLILGELGAALARGAQQNVMACVKHFALNSMENSRFRVDVQVDEHDLHEVYLPHFKKIIQSGCFAVMSAYNSVQGEYCGDNRVLLTEILRDEWKFEGLVMSDFIWGLRKPVASTKNGLDVEMTFRQQRARALPAALESGELSENELRAPCLRLIATQLRHYAQLSQKKPSTDCLACTEHTELARKAAAQGMVLLKNTSSTGAPPLPLSPTTKRVALVGKLASQPNLGDKGSSNVHPPYVRTILQGFQANMDFDTDYTTGSDSAASIKSASEADVAVVVVGMDAHDEGEYIITDDFTTMTLFPAVSLFLTVSRGGDRASLGLRNSDSDLIRRIVKANANTILILVGGSAIMLDADIRETVPSILMAWYPGMEGGDALQDVLTGRSEPRGRMPLVTVASEEDVPFWKRVTDRITYGRFWGYRLLNKDEKKAAFPFGFGLGYGTIDVRTLQIPFQSGTEIVCTVECRNNGTVTTSTVVQIYAGKVRLEEFDFKRVLVGFQTVTLQPGEHVSLHVNCSLELLGRRELATKKWSIARGDIRIEAAQYEGDPRALEEVVGFEGGSW